MESSSILKSISTLENFNEIAIVFSKSFKNQIKSIYEDLTMRFPTKDVYLVPSNDILCSAKCDKYEAYVLVGIECPIHTFENAVQFKVELKPEVKDKIKSYDGKVALDSIYTNDGLVNKSDEFCESEAHGADTPILVVTENQMVFDYYSYKYENIEKSSEDLKSRTRVSYLMKENASGGKLENKRMVGVVFTSRAFEDIATSLVKTINQFSRAYKIFLKDVSYERLISIDNIDCIVLVDCPFFQCSFDLHIPILTPFSVNCYMTEKWSDQYNRNSFECSETKELAIQSHAGEIMETRWFKGAVFRTEEEDMNIYKGRKGIATEYDDEGKI
ncbi:uncharacterized protein VICG_01456 [Vittaforma corneae ATCC 50505]|uniref:2-(3-amino-3-carboxypropyl)histidine synthase subunit 2 n=1 Tax=Vittaforma corneae (strain ATCC 50505) TaxID=993615 RepID=L2GMF1_VITCO|nr:uncharacterized protein VICG_01456 [Vittaforma corneae ATCC 50505]ELA41472.1 hypothetical protein VICG_01456 [Vittaforma corneae ATCC 50505]